MSETGKEYGEFLKKIRTKKEPYRIKYACTELQKLGYAPKYIEVEKYIAFIHKNYPVRLYPFTGWYTGKAVKDGRGLTNLLKQLK